MAWIWIPAGIWILLALMETVGKSQQHLGNAEFPRNLRDAQGDFSRVSTGKAVERRKNSVRKNPIKVSGD